MRSTSRSAWTARGPRKFSQTSTLRGRCGWSATQPRSAPESAGESAHSSSALGRTGGSPFVLRRQSAAATALSSGRARWKSRKSPCVRKRCRAPPATAVQNGGSPSSPAFLCVHRVSVVKNRKRGPQRRDEHREARLGKAATSRESKTCALASKFPQLFRNPRGGGKLESRYLDSYKTPFHAMISRTGRACSTPVRRWSRPWKRKVCCSCSRPSSASSVA